LVRESLGDSEASGDSEAVGVPDGEAEGEVVEPFVPPPEPPEPPEPPDGVAEGDEGDEGAVEDGDELGDELGDEEGDELDGLGLGDGLGVGVGVAERDTGGAMAGGTPDPAARSCCHDQPTEPPAGTVSEPTPADEYVQDDVEPSAHHSPQ
jgi:hypothetical protein